MSRGFVASLAGIGMTLFAWFGPFEWPAWPAFTVIGALFGSHTAFSDLSHTARSIVVVVLIIVNVAFWGGVAYAATTLVRRLITRGTNA